MNGVEGAFGDAIDHLHMEVSHDGYVERAVGVMAQRFFRFYAGTVRVGWAARRDDVHRVVMKGASFEIDRRSVPADGHEVDWEPLRTHTSFAVSFGRTGQGGRAIVIGAMPRGDGKPEEPSYPRLSIELDGPLDAESDKRVDFFRCYMRGQQTVYQTVRSIKAASLTRKWTWDVTALAGGSEAGLVDRLRRASELVDELAGAPWSRDARNLVERLARWAVHEELGTGWGVERLVGRESGPVRAAFARRLRELAMAWASEEPGSDDGGVSARLSCLVDIFEGPSTLESLPVGRWTAGTEAAGYSTFREWTWLQGLARRELRSGDMLDDDPQGARWDTVASRARAPLSELATALWVKGGAGAGGRGAELAFLRSWLQLWFALEVLRTWSPEIAGCILRSERWIVRADVAYVVSESLRFILMGADPEYRFQPAALSAALRTLVAFHCHKIVGVPDELDVVAHLGAIADAEGTAGYHFAMGHLQHAMDVYVAGQFLSELVVERSGGARPERWSVGHVLASRPGLIPADHSRAEFRIAFAIASVFHDVGMMLVAPRRHTPEYVLRDDDVLIQHLGELATRPSAAGAALVGACIADLRGTECLGAGEGPLKRWLDAQVQRGVPDHALVGAWYLQRIGLRATETSPESVRAAVRAVLLHAATECRIDSRKDPVAALLVLCDELFEWTPFERAPPDPNSVSRTPHAMAVDVEPHISRVARVTLEDVVVSADAEGVRARLAHAGQPWPRLTLYLRHPEFLDVPVYRSWLSATSNIGRLTRTEAGWGPTLTMLSAIPDRADSTRSTLIRAMRRTRLPIRAALERWLSDGARFRSAPEAWGERDCIHVAAEVDLGAVGSVLDEFCREIDGLARDDEDRYEASRVSEGR